MKMTRLSQHSERPADQMFRASSEFEIFRGALAKIFIDPIINQVKPIFDESVDHFEQTDDGVVVTFTKTKDVKTYDFLVAADGIWSKIRGMMLNSKPRSNSSTRAFMQRISQLRATYCGAAA